MEKNLIVPIEPLKHVPWYIHYVFDEDPEGRIINSHTHGIAKKYRHPDLQITLPLPDYEVKRILNTVGIAISLGQQFEPGDMINGIYTDCNVRVDESVECGRKVLRLIIPDRNNIFPEDDKCEDHYKYQTMPLRGDR